MKQCLGMPAVMLLLLCAGVHSLRAAEYEVDADLARPVSRGGLQIASYADIAALGDWRRDHLIFAAVPGVDGWHIIDPSGRGYAVELSAGAYAVEGGPMGGDRYGRVYDGVSDADTTGTLSLSVSDTLFVEVLLKTDFTVSYSGPVIRYGAYADAGFFRLHFIGGNLILRSRHDGGFVNSQVAAPDSAHYHVVRAVLRPRGQNLWMNAAADADTFDANTLPDSSERLVIADGTFAGRIAYLGLYAGTPDPTSRDTLYHRIIDHIDGTDAFASVQPAVHHAGTTAAMDTLVFATGLYLEKLAAANVLLRGTRSASGPVVGLKPPDPVPGIPVIQSDSSLSMENIVVHAKGGTAIQARGACNLTGVHIKEAKTGIVLFSHTGTDTLLHCTIETDPSVSGTVGIQQKNSVAGDTVDLVVLNTVISGADTAVAGEGHSRWEQNHIGFAGVSVKRGAGVPVGLNDTDGTVRALLASGLPGLHSVFRDSASPAFAPSWLPVGTAHDLGAREAPDARFRAVYGWIRPPWHQTVHDNR
ncbi:hypothetical protein GF324_07325 [bacterium]|nr:hypothetical protein [bacterium]